MKTKLLLLFLLANISYAQAQKQTTYDEPQWKIRLFFEDATGAKDTLTIGYDPTASIYLDEYEPQFGEVFTQVDTTQFHVYTRKAGAFQHPIPPPIDTDSLMKTTITSWHKPYTEIGFIHGQLPVTMTWEEVQLDSPSLPSNFTNYEDYPRARIDFWIDLGGWWVIPDCWGGVADPSPPTVILASDISYQWPMSWCEFTESLFLDTEEAGIELANAIGPSYLIIPPYKYVYWMSSGVNDLLNQSFSIHPNPVTSSLFITNKNNINIQSINLYDLFGQLLLTEKNNFEEIAISQLSQGIYFVKISTAQGSAFKKIIKN